MRYWLVIIIIIKSNLLYQQNKTSYFKVNTQNFAVSATSSKTVTAKVFNFNYTVYKVLVDSLANQLIVSVRQKDPNGRLFTNRGYHLTLRENDSIAGILEDSKLDINLMGDFLLLSNNSKSSRYNRIHGYEQFEFPSKIIFPIRKNFTGLTYNPAFKTDNQIQLRCVNLHDGSLVWSAPISCKDNWNGTKFLNDSVLIIAAGGLHAVNINKGLLWSYNLITSDKTTKPLIYSSFNQPTFDSYYNGIFTAVEEGQITQIASNILVCDGVIYFASKNKLIAVSTDGKLLWEQDMTGTPISDCILFDNKENILLINLGVAQYNDNTVQYGKTFAAAYNKQTGSIALEKNENAFSNVIDIETMKGNRVLCNRKEIIQISEDLKIQSLIDLSETKYGKFLEFVNGDEYYVEKEGFFVPLNFINNSVIYFKTDHGKVFGLNNTEIEYEYHYTELYKFNSVIGNKKLLSQKYKSYLISENYELLYTINSGEKAIVLKNKIYFPYEKTLSVLDLNELK
jgi:hypothetical protein